MIQEIAEIDIDSGREDAFERVLADTLDTLRAADGCHGLRVLRGVEHPGRYRLVLDWETVEHHAAFRGTPEFAAWGRVVGPFFADAPRVEHIEDITAGLKSPPGAPQARE